MHVRGSVRMHDVSSCMPESSLGRKGASYTPVHVRLLQWTSYLHLLSFLDVGRALPESPAPPVDAVGIYLLPLTSFPGGCLSTAVGPLASRCTLLRYLEVWTSPPRPSPSTTPLFTGVSIFFADLWQVLTFSYAPLPSHTYCSRLVVVLVTFLLVSPVSLSCCC